MKCYIDMDIVAYRSAASCEPTKTKEYREDLETAIKRADELLFRILAECDTDDYVGFLSGEENFRKLLYPAYKANRDHVRRPEHLQPVREFLVSEWRARVVQGYEADDAIGIAYSDPGIICSIDKDFRQIPGRHYNFVTYQMDQLNPTQADHHFWCSMLIGDRADNVPGIPGIGVAKAPRVLSGHPRDDWRFIVKELYESYDMDFDLNYDLLHILRDEGEWWEIENKLEKGKGKNITADSGSGDSKALSGADST